MILTDKKAPIDTLISTKPYDLTEENYYSSESNREFMSVSQYKDFQKCESMAMAKLNGEFQQKSTIALMVGSYVDAYFEGTLDIFCAKHPEIFTEKYIETPETVFKLMEVGGGFVTKNNTLVSKKIKEAKETYPQFFEIQRNLKADYIKADEIIERVEKSDLFMEYMSGEKQTILTAEMFGTPWKIKIDSYCSDKIVDLKCMRSLERIMGRSFVEHWGYDIQMAVYAEVERIAKQRDISLETYLAVATKEDVTNIELICVSAWRRAECLEQIEKDMPRILAVKNGTVEPHRCGVCDYCKATKVLTEPIDMDLVGFNNYEIEMIGE